MNNLGLIWIQKGRPFDSTPFLAKAMELKKDEPTFHNAYRGHQVGIEGTEREFGFANFLSVP